MGATCNVDSLGSVISIDIMILSLMPDLEYPHNEEQSYKHCAACGQSGNFVAYK